MRIRRDTRFSPITSFRLLVAGLGLALGGASTAFGALPKVPEGFQIRLVAAVPAVQYPSQVATAPDGTRYAIVVMMGSTTSSIPARMQLMQAVSGAVAEFHGR